MPGLATMEGASNPQRSFNNQVHNNNDNNNIHPPLVKDEIDDRDLFAEEDDHDDGSYRTRPQLSQPNVHMRSLASLIKDLEGGVIDVHPEYQREVVWTAERMTGLVDSLMENYYIPPIIFNAKKVSDPQTASKTREVMVCVDGKQRLSSVRAFVKGMIPCHDHRGEKWWFCEAPGTRRKKVLPEETQRSFLDKDFVTFQFTELTPVQEEDLFARVQMGVQLSAAEKMRATTGPWQELARLFVDDFTIIYSLMKDRARAKDFQLTLSSFSQIVEATHPSAANGIPILKTNYSALPKLLSNKGAVDDALKSHLASVWNTFKELIEMDSDVFTNADKHLRGVQTFAPVEMVAVTVLISMHSETRNNRLLLGDITALREALREHFTDLRLNAQVWKFVWDFIDDLESIRGAVDGSTVNRNLPTQQHAPSSSTATATATVVPPVPVSFPPASRTVSYQGPKPKAKPPSTLPPQEPVAMKEEPGTPSDARPPKRKRTDPAPPVSSQSSGSLPNGNMTSSHHANGNVSFREYGFPHQVTKSPYPPVSTAPNLQSVFRLQPNIASTPHPATIPPRTSKPTQFTTHSATGTAMPSRYPANQSSSGHSIGKQMSTYTPNMSEPAPPHIPPRTQSTPVSNQHSYRAPTAPMGPSPSTTQLAPNLSMGSPYTTTIPSRQSRPPSNKGSGSRQGVGAFAPVHTDADWDGTLNPISPPMPQNPFLDSAPVPPQPSLPSKRAPDTAPIQSQSSSPSTTVPNSAPSPSQPPSSATFPGSSRPKHKKRKSVTRPTAAQIDGVIDLTSDTELEEERQNLLSAFKGNSVKGKQPQVPSTRRVSTAPIQRHPVVVHDVESDDDMADAHNTYARYRKGSSS